MRSVTIDELAAAIQSGPRPLAMLAGAGISRTAGVPTGQELLTQLARARGEDPGTDPVKWFLTATGTFPNYFAMAGDNPASDALPPAPYERAAPTPAQRAIAALVAAGWIGPVITPNLDPLLERALHQAGLAVPSVHQLGAMAELMAHDAAALEPGAAPVLIKVHGDYRDISLRHTSPALHHYHPLIDHLLHTVLARFDLLVSGWSASWDIPLTTALRRAPTTRRLHWLQCGPPSEAATSIFTTRHPTITTITSSDQGLTDLNTHLLTPNTRD